MSLLRRIWSGGCTTPAVLVPVLVAGFWPVWRWYGARMTDGSDEPLGWFALVVAVVFLPRQGWQTGRPARWLGAAAATLALYVATFAITPPLIRAALAMSVLACVLPEECGRSRLPRYALLLLSLPVIASLQYYLGYPLRALTAWGCAHALGLTGLVVESRGTVLTWAGGEVLLDAPCSGIRMLWMAAFLSATLAAWQRLSTRRSARLLQIAGALVFTANLARSFVLFFLETGLWPNPAGAHEAVGLAAFALVVGGCTWSARRLRPKNSRQPVCHVIRDKRVGTPRETDPAQCHVLRDTRFLRGSAGRRAAGVVVVVVGLAMAGLGIATERRAAGTAEMTPRADAEFAEWPTTFEARPLERVPLHPVEEKLARDFPGAIAAFSDGDRRIVLRQIAQATRKVHPIADCLRASGYTVAPVAARRDRDGLLWAALEARKDAEQLAVHERFFDDHGHSWTDASAWYWSALLQPRNGPWHSITVLASSTRL